MRIPTPTIDGNKETAKIFSMENKRNAINKAFTALQIYSHFVYPILRARRQFMPY